MIKIFTRESIIKVSETLTVVVDKNTPPKKGEHHIVPRIMKECGIKSIAITDDEALQCMSQGVIAWKIIGTIGFKRLHGVAMIDIDHKIRDMAIEDFKSTQSEFGSKALEELAIVDWIRAYKYAKSHDCFTERHLDKIRLWCSGDYMPLKPWESVIDSFNEPKEITEIELQYEEVCCGLLGGSIKDEPLQHPCDFCSKRGNFKLKIEDNPNGAVIIPVSIK